jgi:CubicO group peptidase (beta-lactamase class C family)
MTQRKKELIVAAVALGAIAAAYGIWHTARVMSIASAYYAKTMCSAAFVAGRNASVAVADDVLPDMQVGLRHWNGEIDYDRRLVEVNLFGMARREALYRPGLGCTLVTETTPQVLLKQVADFAPPPPPGRSTALWPEGDSVDTQTLGGFDRNMLKAAVDEAFEEPRAERFLRRSRAVVIVHKGRIVAERYADGFGPHTPQAGWSMGKTIQNALIGTLARDGRLALTDKGLFAEWRGESDPRKEITVEHLLRMVSGLDFDQPHTRMLSDVRKMLFLKGDSAAYAKSEELADPVGTLWFYASGSTTLLASAMRDALGGSLAQYFAYPRQALFEPLGMNTAVIEPDAAGTFVTPAFVFASARDWARFGLFFLNDGVWQGKRILPEGWVKMSRTVTPQSGGQYGAHLWLTIPEFLRPAYDSGAKLPEDAFYMLGHDGQMVAMIPSQDLVVVRLGLSRRRNAWDHEAFLANVLKAFR